MGAAVAAARVPAQPKELEFDEEQLRVLSETLFDAQIATLRAITREVGRTPDADVRRSVLAYTATFAQLRGAAGQIAHGHGWFGYPYMNETGEFRESEGV